MAYPQGSKLHCEQWPIWLTSASPPPLLLPSGNGIMLQFSHNSYLQFDLRAAAYGEIFPKRFGKSGLSVFCHQRNDCIVVGRRRQCNEEGQPKLPCISRHLAKELRSKCKHRFSAPSRKSRLQPASPLLCASNAGDLRLLSNTPYFNTTAVCQSMSAGSSI